MIADMRSHGQTLRWLHAAANQRVLLGKKLLGDFAARALRRR
jgi:hypothetical protein